MGDLDELALQFRCPYCGSAPQVWCVTLRGYSRPPGQRSPWLHEGRAAPFREAWRIGWKAGQRAQVDHIATALAAAQDRDLWAEREGIPVLPPAAWPPLRAWLTRLQERLARG